MTKRLICLAAAGLVGPDQGRAMVKNSVKRIIYYLHQVTALLDRGYLNSDLTALKPPVFIIGVPRSGTTLLYQAFMKALDFAYFPNIANTFYMCPVFVTKMALFLGRSHVTSFASRYGRQQGWMAPSEAGNVWNRWFPHENREGYNYTPADYLNLEDIRDIHQIFAQFERMFEAPVLSKNVKTCVRLPAIHRIFPDARIIWIRRRILDTALSILKVRREKGLKWWSVLPEQIEGIRNLSELEQVAYQVTLVSQTVERDILSFPTEHRYEVQYEDFCVDPRAYLEESLGLLSGSTKPDQPRLDEIPSKFQATLPDVEGWVSDDEVKSLERILSDLN